MNDRMTTKVLSSRPRITCGETNKRIIVFLLLIHFCIILGKWSNLSTIGQCIPPASHFIIDKINNTRAVLFGGAENGDTDDDTDSNNIYILEISVSTVVC